MVPILFTTVSSESSTGLAHRRGSIIFTKWVKNNGMKEERNRVPLTQSKGEEHFCFFLDCSGAMGPPGCTHSLSRPKPSQVVPPILKHPQSPPPPLSSVGSFSNSPHPPTPPHLSSQHLQPHKHSHSSFWALYLQCPSSPLEILFILQSPF